MKYEAVLTFEKFSLLLVGACLFGGCGESGPPTYPVAGEVIYTDRTPLGSGGRIIFVSTNVTPPVTGKGYLEADGKFKLTLFNRGEGFVEGTGLEAGDYEVAVLPDVPDDRGTMSQAAYLRAMEPIEERYTRPATSGLKFTVAADSEPHEFRVVVRRPGRRGLRP